MSGVPQQADMSNDRASRLRDNKRRHRTRQKEYLLDLERRLAQTREQGIQATKEVQLAAQRVARENAMLRDLLATVGFTKDGIENWLMGGGHRDSTALSQLVTLAKSKEKVVLASPQQTKNVGDSDFSSINISENGNLNESSPVQAGANRESQPRVSLNSTEQLRQQTPEISPKKSCTSSCTKASLVSGNLSASRGPCKVLTLLAENPAADITQVHLSSDIEKQLVDNGESKPCTSEGVECSTAYKMLMQYATSEDKRDKIAVALESGCTPSASGGCKVDKSVVWRILDEECT